MNRIRNAVSIVVALLSIQGGNAWSQTGAADSSKRMVLVELYTSQGCDMCPTAEEVLGKLAAKDRRIVPIAFHVDYFNSPWEDTFSDQVYSQRQGVYNELYKRPKNADYGLYYTPMLMIDGIESANGRDPAGAEAAIKKAMARKPGVKLDVELALGEGELTGDVDITMTSLSPKSEGTPLIVSAVLREDGVAVNVLAGENGGKRLVSRFPARLTKYDSIELEGKKPKVQKFPLTVGTGWNRKNTRLAVFVQNVATGEILQSADIPWKSTGTKSASKATAAASKADESQ